MDVRYVKIDRLEERFDVNWRTIYKWIEDRGFPKPTKFTRKCSRWNLAEVEVWEEARK
jgi:prophage regulatory protein